MQRYYDIIVTPQVPDSRRLRRLASFYCEPGVFLLRAWQPPAARLAVKNLLRTTEGGEELRIIEPGQPDSRPLKPGS